MQEMTDAEIEEAVGRGTVGVLALADDDRAYGIPIAYAYEDGSFYWRSHPGIKESYIHDTEEACLTIVEGFDLQEWESVMAFGEPEPVWDETEIEEAERALADVPPPPAMGEDEEGQPLREGKHAVYWRMRADRLTGRKSQPS